MEWLAFFTGIAAAMLLGYLGMAHPSRSVFLEIASFCLAMIAGLVAGTVILSMARIGWQVYLITVFETCTAALCTALPRLAWQSLRARQITIGLLFRMTAYVAFLLVLESHDVNGFGLWGRSLGVFIAGIAFGVMWGFTRVVPGWLLWPLIVPAITYMLTVVFFCNITFEPDFDDFVDLWVLPWNWPAEVQELGYGTLTFTILIAATGQLQRSSAAPPTPQPPADPQLSGRADDCQLH